MPRRINSQSIPIYTTTIHQSDTNPPLPINLYKICPSCHSPTHPHSTNSSQSESRPLNPPPSDGYNPQQVITNLLTLSNTLQTNPTSSTFTQWRNQLSHDLAGLVSHAHLLEPSDLLTLLHQAIAKPLIQFNSALIANAALCFRERHERIVSTASCLAIYLQSELGAKDAVVDEQSSGMVEWREGMQRERMRLNRERVLVSASTLREAVEVYGVPRARRGKNAASYFAIDTDGVVTIHESLKVNLVMLAAAVGCLSLNGRTGSDAFANEVRRIKVPSLDKYLFSNEDYLGAFWSRLTPSEETCAACKCLQCKEVF